MNNQTWKVGELLPIHDNTRLMSFGQYFNPQAAFLGCSTLISIDAGGVPQVPSCLDCKQVTQEVVDLLHEPKVSLRGFEFRITTDKMGLIISTPANQVYLLTKKPDSRLLILDYSEVE